MTYETLNFGIENGVAPHESPQLKNGLISALFGPST